MGCTQQYVAKVTTENSESEELVVPDRFKSWTDKADYRKLPEDLRADVDAKRMSLNRKPASPAVASRTFSLQPDSSPVPPLKAFSAILAAQRG